jgi:hypothetical protein
MLPGLPQNMAAEFRVEQYKAEVSRSILQTQKSNSDTLVCSIHWTGGTKINPYLLGGMSENSRA